MHLADELNRFVVRKMMQHLRCYDEIECPRRKRKCQRIAGNSGDRELPRRANELHATVESKHIERHPMVRRELPQSVRDVSGAGANIEQGGGASGFAEPRRQFRLYSVNTAKEPVGEGDVTMRAALQRRIAVFVEILNAPPSRRREKRHR